MNWNQASDSGIWEMVHGGWHAVVFPEANGMWNGFVEMTGSDEADRIFCPAPDPQVEHIKAWSMTEIGRQEAAQEAQR